MIQEGRVSQAQQDAYTLQAKAAENLNTIEVYQLHDAETSITFSQDDHPLAVPRPGHAPQSTVVTEYSLLIHHLLSC